MSLIVWIIIYDSEGSIYNVDYWADTGNIEMEVVDVDGKWEALLIVRTELSYKSYCICRQYCDMAMQIVSLRLLQQLIYDKFHVFAFHVGNESKNDNIQWYF